MATLPGTIADALITALEAPGVQTALTEAISAGEVQLQTIVDAAIEGAKGSGVLGIVIAASKGTVAAEVNAEIAKYPPATIAAYLTKLAQDEAKALGG